MALEQIKKMIKQISETPNVKKVLDDVQAKRSEIEMKIRNIDTDKAVKKYKELVKGLTTQEAKLQKELKTVISKVKKTADEVESNIEVYRKKADAQRERLEKIVKQKAQEFSGKKSVAKSGAKATAKSASKKKTTKKAASKKKAAARK